MYKHLEHNMKVIFKSSELGAHHDWVSATTFDELVTKIDEWWGMVFKWMDDMAAARRALGHLYLPPVLENRIGGVVVLFVVAQPPHLCTSVWQVLSTDSTQVWMMPCIATQPHDIIYAPLKFARALFPTRLLDFSLYPSSTFNSDSPEEAAHRMDDEPARLRLVCTMFLHMLHLHNLPLPPWESEYILRLLAARRPAFERAARMDDIHAKAADERATSDAGVEGSTPSLPQRADSGFLPMRIIMLYARVAPVIGHDKIAAGTECQPLFGLTCPGLHFLSFAVISLDSLALGLCSLQPSSTSSLHLLPPLWLPQDLIQPLWAF
ncbi:hypothetical protein DFH07DRAFT_958112 [Mycena maculata]|uniref:Uncharacterized protein n=1 Tax=Mycena maculata TaxID=230809 RepID=A0AAD7JB29_9AGAR|nr:hypothetical protein DFH07DRAFT_958112 [Mycena maculata]